MKKLLLYIISIFIIFDSIPAMAVSPDWTYDKKIEIITGEQLVSEETKQQADVVQKLLFNLQIINEIESGSVHESALRSSYTESIAKIRTGTLESLLDIIEKETKITVGKDKFIKLDEAIAYAVYASGYSIQAEVTGNYPASYIKIAENIGLLKGISYKDAYMTVAEMNQLLYNVISVPTAKISSSGNGEYLISDSNGKTIMESRYNMKLIKGVITAVGSSGLYGKSELGDSFVEIDRKIYYLEDKDALEFLGYSVAAFVRDDDTVVAIEEYKNTMVHFKGDGVDKISDNTVFLENKKLKYDNSTRLVYNGLYQGNAQTELEKIFSASALFKAVDNNKDNTIDVFIVWDYKNYVAEYDVGSSGNLVLAYGAKFNDSQTVELDEDINKKITIIKDGVKVEAIEIKAGDAVSIAANEDYSGYSELKVVISSETISGIVKGISSDDNGVYVNIDDENYKMSEEYRNLCGCYCTAIGDGVILPKIGNHYTFIITADKQIAGVEDNSGSLKWGYLVKAYNDDSSDVEESIIRIFTSDGKFVTYKPDNKILFFDSESLKGVKLEGNDVVERIINNKNSEGDIRCMICYSEDNTGRLKELYLPYDNTASLPGSVDYPNTYDLLVTGNKFYHYKFLDNGWMITDDCKLFVVPGVLEKNDEEKYRISSLMSEQSLPATYSDIQLYGADEMRIAESSLWVVGSGGGEKELDTLSMHTMIVNNVQDELNKDDEVVLKLTGYEDGKLVSVSCDNPDIYSQERNNFVGNICIRDIKRGDIIQYITSPSSGTLSQFRVLLQAENKGSYRYLATNGVNTIGYEDMDNLKYYFGFVKFNKAVSKKTENGTFEYINYSIGSGKTNTSIVKSSGIMTDCNYYLYDSTKNKIEVISLSDLREGDDMAFGHSYFNYTYVVVYR